MPVGHPQVVIDPGDLEAELSGVLRDEPADLELDDAVAGARWRTQRVVNTELLGLYWRRLGRTILDRQQTDGWGTWVIDRLSTATTRTSTRPPEQVASTTAGAAAHAAHLARALKQAGYPAG